jgi:hypothetical protein
MERTAKGAPGLYVCSRCRLHAFDTLGRKLAHERACTPANGASKLQLHRSIERRRPGWLDGPTTTTDEAHGSTSASRQLIRVLAGEGVPL